MGALNKRRATCWRRAIIPVSTSPVKLGCDYDFLLPLFCRSFNVAARPEATTGSEDRPILFGRDWPDFDQRKWPITLYERFLGRPFAGHRDSVSGLVGEVMENAVEKRLRQAGISFRKTRQAERIEGFDQAPDFIIPDEWNPQIVIEAKITEDDGTARDKVTRIQHLAEISHQRHQEDARGFQVIACIDGRGFGVRREDMRKLLEATRGKVFTLATLDRMVETTDLKAFQTQ